MNHVPIVGLDQCGLTKIVRSAILFLSNYQRIGNYTLMYENPYDDEVTLTVWKTHREDDLPFSEVIRIIEVVK